MNEIGLSKKIDDPLQIVPTSSSTFSLTIGDMLADELMSLRPLSKESIHPPIKLGYN